MHDISDDLLRKIIDAKVKEALSVVKIFETTS
jgi:hypothetical protein